MRTISSLALVLALCGIVSAGDSLATAPVAATPQAPAVTAAPAACPLITWSGMAMFRLRDEIAANKIATVGPTQGQTQESATFSHQIAYHIGAKIKPNDQLLLAFDIGNDWYATETVAGIPGNYWMKRDPNTPWFDLAYAQWDPGYLHLAAGIIPVRGTALMDLLGVSIFFGKNYKMAAHIPWGVVTNFSQTGLRIGTPLVKGDLKVGVDVMTAMIQQRASLIGIDTMDFNTSAIEYLAEIPIEQGPFKLTPQAFFIPNRSYNSATKKGDLEFGLGIDLGYKLNDAVTLRAGFGYAHNANDSSLTAADTNTGTNLNIGATSKVGPGKFDFDFNLSSEKSTIDSTKNALYPFFDLKYGWAVNKNFIIMPRCRFFITLPSYSTGTNFTSTTIRPELIFVGMF